MLNVIQATQNLEMMEEKSSKGWFAPKQEKIAGPSVGSDWKMWHEYTFEEGNIGECADIWVSHEADRHHEVYAVLFEKLDTIPGTHVFLGRDMDLAYAARIQQLKSRGCKHPHRRTMRLEVNRYMARELSDRRLALSINQQCPRLLKNFHKGVTLIDSGFQGTIPQRLTNLWANHGLPVDKIKNILISHEDAIVRVERIDGYRIWAKDYTWEYRLRDDIISLEHRPHEYGTVEKVDSNGHIVTRRYVSELEKETAKKLKSAVVARFSHKCKAAEAPKREYGPRVPTWREKLNSKRDLHAEIEGWCSLFLIDEEEELDDVTLWVYPDDPDDPEV